MTNNTKMGTALTVSVALLLGSCASQPMGPTVQVLPAPNKPFQMFQQDQTDCKSYAQSQVAGQAEAANDKAVGSALLGAALGAGLGAAVGGGRGAGVGAAGGAVIGTDVGAAGSNHANYSIQQQYNNAYTQCMYSKGNQVPGVAPAVVSPVYQPPPPPPPPPPH